LISAVSGCATYEKCGLNGCPGDAKITTAIEAQLNKQAGLDDVNLIRVHTLNHVVYLTGEVSDALEAQIAESIARKTTGVAQVDNAISVTN
jgi:osmotically-inducible protein OsmY